MQTTSSCCTSNNLRESINCLLWSWGETSLSGSNFGKRCCISGTAMTFVANQGLLASMVARKLKFGLGDAGLVQVGLFLGGLGGLEPPTYASGKSWKVESTSGKSRKNWNLGSS